MSLSPPKFPSRTGLLESSVDFRNGPHRILSPVMSRRPYHHSERHHHPTIEAAPGDAEPGGGRRRGDLSTPRAGPPPQFILWSTTEGTAVLACGGGSVRLICRFSYDRRVYRPACDVMENDPVDGRGCPRVDAHYGDTLRISRRVRTNR